MALELTFKMNAESKLLYSSDYPRWDMDLPSTIYDLPFRTERTNRDTLDGNGRRLFNPDPVFFPAIIERKNLRVAAKPSKSRRDL
jgi:uncharacterized protein